jgi:hypothetical protein
VGIFRRDDAPDYSDVSELQATDAPPGSVGVLWCQSCGGQFVAGSTTTCFDCGGQLWYEQPVAVGDDNAETEAASEEVEYDLSEWPAASLRALGAALEERGVPFVLEAEELVVRAADEAEVDDLLEDVRRVWEGDTLGIEPLALPSGVDITEHDLADWSRPLHIEVQQRLRVAVVPFELTEEGVLRTPTADDELVTHVLDAVEFPDALPEGADDDHVPSDLPPAMDVLSDLYVATDRLKDNARDARAVQAAIAGVEDLVELSVPYGFDAAAWEGLVAEADVLWELLVDGGELDDIEASARRLRDLLHPMV